MPMPRLALLLFPTTALAIGACSLLFEASKSSDGGGPHGDANHGGDAGALTAWEPVVEWSQSMGPFSPKGLVQDSSLSVLIGDFNGAIEVAGVNVEPSGASDTAFMSINISNGSPLGIDSYGGPGSVTILDHNGDGAGHGLVGIYKGTEELCSAEGSCTSTAAGLSTSAFASLYASPPTSGSTSPTSVVTFDLATPTKTVDVRTLINSSVSFEQRHVVVGSYANDIVVSGTSSKSFTNVDPTTPNLLAMSLGFDGEILESLNPDLEGRQVAWGVEASGSSDVYIVGSYVGPLKLGIDDGPDELPSAGSLSIFVLCSNRGLSEARWTLPFGSGIASLPLFSKASDDDALYVAGTFEDTLFLPNGESLVSETGGDTAFLMKISAQGALAWARSFGGGATTRVRGLELGPEGDVYLAGDYDGILQIGDTELASSKGLDGYLLRLDASGRVRGAIDFGGDAGGATGNDFVSKLIPVEDGSVLLSMIYTTTEAVKGVSVGPGRVLFKIH